MQQDKFKTLQILPILLFITSLAGCSSSAKIRSDYDPGADFASYKTWDFIEDAGPDHEGYESLFSQYMVTAITLEMDKRGYTRSDNPDLLVNFNAYLQDKTKVTTTPSAPPMGVTDIAVLTTARGVGTVTAPIPTCHSTQRARSTLTLSMRGSSSWFGKLSVLDE